jgi:hypothetical protein
MADTQLYAGALLDAAGGSPKGPWYYPPDDLTTHGLIVGMTGSGKTGLALVLLEELLRRGTPLVALDPKGDLTNLCLAFPDLSPAAFRPWVSESEARRRGESPDDAAAAVAARWREGLAQWNILPEQLREYRERVVFRVLTPGSEVGTPVNLLDVLRPEPGDAQSPEARRDRIAGAVSAILGLVGIEADPIQSPEHILLSNILEYFWSRGLDVSFESLLMAIQSPPLQKLGIFPLDEIYPPPQRKKLALALNAVLAAPNFESWREGVALRMDQWLAPAAGRTPCTIVYMAHLKDEERMFVVSAVLNELLGWVRRQQGSDSLRALLYFDEIAGYLPPYPANPASKAPLMTLLKQARAFGLGVLLATQNPVDVDYKAMTNAGTWLVGKLQAQGDKDRLLDGLALATGAGPSRRELDDAISALKGRQFLLKNVHQAATPFVTTRWAMSYLAGPLSLQNLPALFESGLAEREIPGASPAAVPATLESPAASPPAGIVAAVSGVEPAGADLAAEPQIFPAWPRLFVPPGSAHAAEVQRFFPLVDPAAAPPYRYLPFALARLRAVFDEERDRFTLEQTFFRMAGPLDRDAALNWENVTRLWAEAPPASAPLPGAGYAGVNSRLLDRKAETELERAVLEDVWREESVELYRHALLKLSSRPGQTRTEFEAQCRQALDDLADRQSADLKQRYQKRLDALQQRLDRERMELLQKQSALDARKREELVSAGESIIGLFFGSRSRRGFSQAVNKRGQTERATQAVEMQNREVEELGREIRDLEQDLLREMTRAESEMQGRLSEIETVPVRLEKSDIQLLGFTLVWLPTPRC